MNTAATVAFVALVLALSWTPAHAHDASAWGGLFRSRDHGTSWVFANTGSFVGGAIALAVSPTDSNHLLLATDTGLLRSRNGGRDWALEAPSVLVGSVTAVAFDASGTRALASTASAMYVSGDGASWQKLRISKGATPPRAIVASRAGHIYVAGSRHLVHSEDWGASWAAVPAHGLPDEPITVLAISPAAPESLYVVAGGTVYAKAHDARDWARLSEGLPSTVIDALGFDRRHPGWMWAVAASQVFQRDDAGARWRPIGRPLSEPVIARGIAVGGNSIILTTTRGLYRSMDLGGSWELVSENLPAHLEAGPLVSDPADPATLYAGFSLRPYSELWRPAVDQGPLREPRSVTGLAGAAVVVGLVGLAVGVTLPRLGRRRRC